MVDDLIFDVGLHNGDDTEYYLHRGFRVVAVEANPALAARGAERFRREIAEGRLTIANVGVADRIGVLPFWICDAKLEWSSFNREIAARDGSAHHAIDVPSVTFDSLLAEHGVPHYLKVDIEGNDHLCLAALRAPELPVFVSVEAGAETVPWLAGLRDLGYSAFKCISQSTLLPLEVPPAREQRRFDRAHWIADGDDWLAGTVRRLTPWRWLKPALEGPRVRPGWRFPMGSSGAFGEDTPGRWLSYEEICRAYADYAERHRRREPSPFWDQTHDYSFWADFHARRDA
jgi:FkbM family methyltransferase